MHPSTEAILQHFDFDHLPTELQQVSKRFHDLAHDLANMGTSGAETTTALRKLLEAKDAAVRAHRTERVNTGLDEGAMGTADRLPGSPPTGG